MYHSIIKILISDSWFNNTCERVADMHVSEMGNQFRLNNCKENSTSKQFQVDLVYHSSTWKTIFKNTFKALKLGTLKF